MTAANVLRFRKKHKNYAAQKMREYRAREGWRYGWPAEQRRVEVTILGVRVRADYLRVVKHSVA